MKRVEVIFKLDNKQTPRVMRGGAWYSGPVGLCAATRYSAHNDSRSYSVGFHLVQER